VRGQKIYQPSSFPVSPEKAQICLQKVKQRSFLDATNTISMVHLKKKRQKVMKIVHIHEWEWEYQKFLDCKGWNTGAVLLPKCHHNVQSFSRYPAI
jgi:hypothetical protein